MAAGVLGRCVLSPEHLHLRMSLAATETAGLTGDRWRVSVETGVAPLKMVANSTWSNSDARLISFWVAGGRGFRRPSTTLIRNPNPPP